MAGFNFKIDYYTMIIWKRIILSVIIPAMGDIPGNQYHIVLIEQFDAIPDNSRPVTLYIQNQLIFRVKMP